ncbi:MAG TPA: flagellar protein FlaG [Spongiibacteraceae bacterium]|jgi:flagellar protein FlaG
MINSIVNTGFQPAVEAKGGATSSAANIHVPATSPQETSPKQDKAVDAAQLKEAVTKLNDYVQNIQRDLSFSVDKDSGQTVVKVYDVQTKELIRQIPSDETLKLAASIKEQVNQFFVKEKA